MGTTSWVKTCPDGNTSARQYNDLMNTQRILVTGSAGRIGRAAVAELVARGHHVTGFDVRPTPGLPRRAVDRRHARGHGCASPRRERRECDHPPRGHAGRRALPARRAARRRRQLPLRTGAEQHRRAVSGAWRRPASSKVPRVILASTGQVIDGHLRDGQDSGEGRTPRRDRATSTPARRCSSKRSGRCMRGSTASRCSRCGSGGVRATRGRWRRFAAIERGQDVYFSPGDAGRFFAAAVEAGNLPPFATLYATSRFTHQLRYDLSRTRELLGWEPREQWPQGIE